MLLPVALNLQNAPCLVVGGGEIACRKVRSLLECRARVRVVSPQLCESLAQLESQIEYSKRLFQSDDCSGMKLVFACTDSREVNSRVSQCARENGALYSVSDDGQNGDFQSMATLRRGEITVAISTDGGSPALSKHLKTQIENVVGDEYAQLLRLMSDARTNRVLDVSQSERAHKWRAILQSDVLELLRRGENEAASQRVDEILNVPFNEP